MVSYQMLDCWVTPKFTFPNWDVNQSTAKESWPISISFSTFFIPYFFQKKKSYLRHLFYLTLRRNALKQLIFYYNWLSGSWSLSPCPNDQIALENFSSLPIKKFWRKQHFHHFFLMKFSFKSRPCWLITSTFEAKDDNYSVIITLKSSLR